MMTMMKKKIHRQRFVYSIESYRKILISFLLFQVSSSIDDDDDDDDDDESDDEADLLKEESSKPIENIAETVSTDQDDEESDDDDESIASKIKEQLAKPIEKVRTIAEAVSDQIRNTVNLFVDNRILKR